MAKLLLKFNGAILKELPIVLPETTIGRRPDCDLVIDNPAVSGHHAKVLMEPTGAFFVEDVGSTNGTYLRDRKVTKSPLHHEDELVIAKHSVTFINEEEAARAAAAAVPREALTSDATIVMSSPPPPPKITADKVGYLRTVEGDAPAEPLALTHLTTYIGKSAQAHIKLKGFFQPDLACCIVKKAEGHSLTSLKDKVVKLNGDPLMDQAQVPLKEGDVINVGGLKLLYFLQDTP
ncbi:MAG: FHA domain-containing protein [Elusimicrobia bacterium]|nr:FHA domain-containing protein [Elusimicrobiota bacterium]